jgi:hypothetical protein
MAGALRQWVETYSKRVETIEFFAVGGGLVIADLDDSGELHRLVAHNPFTPFMDVEVVPIIEPTAAMDTWDEVVAGLTGEAQPAT